MDKIRYIEKTLNELFENKRGKSKYTKKYCNLNLGEYEVFTGTTIGSFGFINTYDYDKELLTYTTDGENAGTLKILKGKYSVGGHRAILFPKYKNMNLEYFEKILQKSFFDNVKRGDVPSITWQQIKNNIISIPVTLDGEFDVKKQEEIVNKYKIIDEKKLSLKNKIDYLNNVEIDFFQTEVEKFKNIFIDEIFDIKLNGNNAYFEDKNSLLYFNNLKEIYLSNNLKKVENDNSIQILTLKEKYINKINLEYIEKILQLIYFSNNKNNLKEIEKLKIDIPVDSQENFDMRKQEIILKKLNLIHKKNKKEIFEKIKLYYKNIKILDEDMCIFIPKKIKELFTITRGKGSYTKTWCRNNSGEYPVYSADNSTPLGFMKNYDYNGKYLTVSVNGIAGVIKIIEGKFSTNADRVVLIPKVANLDLGYISNILEGKLRNIAKGRKGVESKNEFTKLTKAMIEEVEVFIPFDIEGIIEEKIQKIISKKYYSINLIKENLSQQVKNLLEVNINFDI